MECDHKPCPACDASVLPELHWQWLQLVRRNSVIPEWHDYMTFRRFYCSVVATDGSQYIRRVDLNEPLGPNNYRVYDKIPRRERVMHGQTPHPWYRWWVRQLKTDKLVPEWHNPIVAMEELDILSDKDYELRPHVLNPTLLIGPDNITFVPRKKRGGKYDRPQEALNGLSIREASMITGFTTEAIYHWVVNYTSFDRFKAEHPIEATKMEEYSGLLHQPA